VDKIPELGYCPATDAQFEASKYLEGVIEHGNCLPCDEWEDPRKGDIFYLIDLLLKKPKGEEEGL